MKTASKSYIAVFIFLFLMPSLFAGCAKEAGPFKHAKDRIAAGKRLISQNRFEEAAKEFKIALQSEPDNFEAHYQLGLAYYNLKEFKKAEEEMRSCLKYKPKDPQVYYRLGLTYEKEGLFDEARQSFQKALSFDKHLEEARMSLANIEWAKRDYNFYRFAMDFIYVLSKEYSNGNNAFMQGIRETTPLKAESGQASRYEINSSVYLAKEYFDKCSKLLEDAADRSSPKEVADVIDLFSMAIQLRQEAIDLQIQGYAVSEGYTGEFERAKAKVKVADTYYVDAAKRLEQMMKGKPTTFDEKDFTNIRHLVYYYSQGYKEKEIEPL